MFELLKKIFIPFYLFKSLKERSTTQSDFAILYGIFLSLYIICRLGYGIEVANDPKHCRVKSIGDVIIAPMYTLGCNIGKDRFDIKVN